MNDGAVIVLCNRQSFNLGEQNKQKKYLYLKKTFCRCDRDKERDRKRRKARGCKT